MMSRKDILDAALKCVNGDRDAQYGNPENNFTLIANLWNVYLSGRDDEGEIKAKDVAAMLALLKLARIATGANKDDNWIDLAGYAACGGEIGSQHAEHAGGCNGDYCEIESILHDRLGKN